MHGAPWQTTRSNPTQVRALTLLALAAVMNACSGDDGSTGPGSVPGYGGTTSGTGGSSSSGPSVSTCQNRCRENADCQYSSCLLAHGTSCGTAHTSALAVCDKITSSTCTQSLLDAYTCHSGSSSGGGSSSSSCAATCDGCCSSTGTCHVGTSSSYCGSDGISCRICSSSQVCRYGECLGKPGASCKSDYDCDDDSCSLWAVCVSGRCGCAK
jgi:hypothetical protein